MKTLIVYFSRADENYYSGTLKYIPVGNTEIIATMIQELTDADIFKIDPLIPYAKSYNECIEEAKQDLQRDARPELKEYPENLDDYDTIYLGYPNYWGTMPMPVFTFLEHFDFTGKTIRPFCTHEGSGLGHSVEDIHTLCPKANIENGLSIHGSRVNNAKKDIETWVK